MTTQYYIISAEDARTLGVLGFRKGGKDGYVVTSGDLVTAPDTIRKAAISVTEREALEYINSIK